MHDKSVTVIGGGLAGIAAALALARHGGRVRLIESRRKLGGRTGSFGEPCLQDTHGDDPFMETVDYCQHVGMGCCTNLKQLIAWLGQTADWQEHSSLHLYGSGGRYRRLTALPWLPAPLHLTSWLARWPGLTLKDRLGIARGMLALRRVQLCATHESYLAIEWLRLQRQTARSLELFWNTIIVSALGEELARVDFASFCKVLQDGFLKHRAAYHLLIPTRPLDILFNRNAQTELERAGVDVLLGQTVSSIARSTESVTVATRSASHASDAVILAIPWHQLSKLDVDARFDFEDKSQVKSRLPGSVQPWDEVVTSAEKLSASPITGIHTWWDRAWLPHAHATLAGRLCQWVFVGPTSNQNRDSCYYQIVISASRELPTGDVQEVERLICEDLAEDFPAVRHSRLLRTKVVTDRRAVFSVTPASAKLRPRQDVLGDRVLLAGDWTGTGWPATMEGAILSGFHAAELLLNRWGETAVICAPPLS
ncbi:MAG: hydroxysqualene dehydroxylase HpnE [Pirellulaceae bacterium]